MISAAILAGGRARRFGGRDKGSLIVEGRTILERQITTLSQIAGEILLVGTDVAAGGVRAVPDRIPDAGPLGGLYTALIEAGGDTTIVIACDMPYVTAPFLAHLAELAREADAVVPQTERGYHPLCAAYTRGCLEAIAGLLAAGHLKMTDAVAELHVRVVTAEEVAVFGAPGRLLANVNTPDDYGGLHELQSYEL